MFENPRRGGQARNFTTNVPKILVLKSSSEQIFSRKLPLGAPVSLTFLPVKFCQETLFEADRALFMNRKNGRVLPVKVVLKLISSHLKWPTKKNHREVSC